MSVLANASNANPSTYYWAKDGGGAATTLQSPVAVLSDGTGSTLLTMNATLATGTSEIQVIGGANQTGTIAVGGGGFVFAMDAVGTGPGPANLQLTAFPTQVGQGPALQYTPSTGSLILGDGTVAGVVSTNQGLLIKDDAGGANGVGITPVSATASTIAQTIASGGTLNLGSSTGAADTLTITDTTGAGSGYVTVGGNGGADIFMVGGNGSTIIPNIRTDAANTGSLTFGGSATNSQTLWVRDAATVSSGFVDITGGDATTAALRLQGSSATVGANNAWVSTNLNSGNSAAMLNLSSAWNDPTPAMQINSSGIRQNLPFIGNQVVQTLTIPALNDGGSAQIPQSPSIVAGLYAIVANNANQDTQTGIQVSALGYYSNGTSPGKWIMGGCGFGQALVNPTRNFAILPTAGYESLTFLNTAGYNMSSGVKVYFIQLTGNLGL